MRTPAAAESEIAPDGGAVIVATGGPAAAEPAQRVAFLGRLGLLLTLLAGSVHLVALVEPGMSADPNRVPWGSMYEFTISGTFVVTLMYLVLYRRYKRQLGSRRWSSASS